MMKLHAWFLAVGSVGRARAAVSAAVLALSACAPSANNIHGPRAFARTETRVFDSIAAHEAAVRALGQEGFTVVAEGRRREHEPDVIATDWRLLPSGAHDPVAQREVSAAVRIEVVIAHGVAQVRAHRDRCGAPTPCPEETTTGQDEELVGRVLAAVESAAGTSTGHTSRHRVTNPLRAQYGRR